MKKLFSILFALVLVLSLSLVTAAPAMAATIDVYPGDSIQTAVDGASPGDEIIVHAGEYHQSVVISTNDIILKGEEGTILDGDSPADPGTTLTTIGIRLLDVSGVTIEGFEVRDYTWDGIQLFNASHNVVKENEVSGSGNGNISLLSGSNYNVVKENEVSDSIRRDGIGINRSSYNLVEENKVSDSGRFGIIIYDSSNYNVVKENEVSGSGLSELAEGIIIALGSNNNVVEENEVSDSSRDGIAIHDSFNNNVVKENKVSDSGQHGISVLRSSGNLIEENEVSVSVWFDLYDSSAPAPLDNTWEDNIYGTKNF